jgi:hypothetical protein
LTSDGGLEISWPTLRRPRLAVLSPLAVIASAVRLTWTHPGNRGHRVRAIAIFALAHLWSRVAQTPVLVRLGKGSIAALRPRLFAPDSKLIYSNTPDWREMRLMRSVLRDGDLFVDVGANIGSYSLGGWESGAEVVVVEAAAEVADLLEMNVPSMAPRNRSAWFGRRRRRHPARRSR